jgi:hypothetical protein
MKCISCKQQDAAFFADCLVVNTSTTSSNVLVGLEMQRQYLTTESFSGEAIVAGLCPKCMKKVSRKIDRDMSLPFKALMLYLLLIVVGLGLFIGAIAAKWGRMTGVIAVGGMIFAILGVVGYVIHKLLLPAQLRRNAPWKLLGKPLGGVRLDDGRFVHLVPVGDGYYKDFAEFSTVNDHLVKEVKQKIESELIETGAWKMLVRTAGR